MLSKTPYVIALEEHYWDPDIAAEVSSWRQTAGRTFSGGMEERLLDLGALRLKEMDASGISFQVISHSPVSTQTLNPEVAPGLIARANDRLSKAVAARSNRFAAFASLPTADPEACADELERAVEDLGCKGAMVPPHTNAIFLDHVRFRPMFERAQALDVPIYIHPAAPRPALLDTYFSDLAGVHRSFATGGHLGFQIEVTIVAVRMIVTGLFDAYPRLKIILGHMGESLPDSLWRLDQSLHIREAMSNNFYITTSGNFSTPALLCAIMELGIDRVLFSVDWPYVQNQPAMDWMATVPLSMADKEKLFNENARRLLKL